jgi:hypothetical protein
MGELQLLGGGRINNPPQVKQPAPQASEFLAERQEMIG